jgi:hypothetical protein
MAQSILLLGTLHEIQGPHFRNSVPDPSYPKLIEEAMSGVDIVFEEASGQRPTIAEQLAESVLGPGNYVDIDPTAAERPGLGIPVSTASGFPIVGTSDTCALLDHDAQRLREEEWLRRLLSRSFKKALAIVGIGHSISFQRRLSDSGLDVTMWAYEPHAKLCLRNH